jgi:hypothetical protein
MIYRILLIFTLISIQYVTSSFKQFSPQCQMPWPWTCCAGDLAVEETCTNILTKTFYNIKCPTIHYNDHRYYEYLREANQCHLIFSHWSELYNIVSWQGLRGEEACLNFNYLTELCKEREYCKRCYEMYKILDRRRREDIKLLKIYN